jgi:hypothetical protein
LRKNGHDFFKNIALLFHMLEFGAQALNLFALNTARHGFSQRLTLPAAQ